MAAKCLRALSGLFSPNLIDQSSCRILTTHAKTRPILHDDWSIWLGENRLGRVFKHLVAMLYSTESSCVLFPSKAKKIEERGNTF